MVERILEHKLVKNQVFRFVFSAGIGVAADGPNFAGTGRFFSSKIATAAEKTPPIMEETK